VVGEAVIAWAAERVHNAAIAIIAVVAMAAICAMLGKLERKQVIKPPRDVEAMVIELSDRMFSAEKRIARLSRLVLLPRFCRHQERCAQCRGETTIAEEGGPAPLCEKGFILMQEDERAQSQEEP
jgi:hypothetical protein